MTKKALVLGGGNTKGAFQAGVLYSLYEQGFEPDYIVGTSIGAINAYILSRMNHIDLLRFWQHLGPKRNYLRYNWRRLFWDGFYDLSPMASVLRSIDFQQHTQVEFSMVELKTGALEFGRSLDSCIASASEPVFMKPVNGYMDGGIREQVPIKRAVDLGYTDITVVINNPTRINPDLDPSPNNLFEIAFRAIDIQTHESFLEDLDDCVNVKMYQPPRVPARRFDFSKENILPALKLGLKIGREIK